MKSEHDMARLKRSHRKVDHRLLIWFPFVPLILRIYVGNISNTQPS